MVFNCEGRDHAPKEVTHVPISVSEAGTLLMKCGTRLGAMRPPILLEIAIRDPKPWYRASNLWSSYSARA